MRETKFLKWAYELNTRLNLADIKFLSGLKQFGKWLMFRVLTSNELIMVRIDGMPFYIHSTPASIQEYILQPYEPYTTELFKRAVKPGAVVLDIGAQFGYYSLLAAKLAGTEGQVLAFEPDPTNYKILKRNIEMNNCSHIIRLIQKAVGAKHGTVAVFIYKDSDSHGIYCHPHVAIKETIEVECVSIDEFLGKQLVDVIKMDIEGNELYALEGMKQTIAKSPNLILFTEFAPFFLRRAGVKPEDYLHNLRKLGFDIKAVDEHTRCLKPVVEDLLAEDDPSWHVNLYCTRKP
jgi:FkbM family methyltransferase